MISGQQSDRIISLLESNERSLKQLAVLAGMDPYDFYRGADLRSLDLRSQDLTSMNFDGADLRFSDLTDAKFDAGAFNGSLLDSKQDWLADEFEFYANDVFHHPITDILIFCRFRPGLVDLSMVALDLKFSAFSKKARVSDNALRKARRGEVVAHETAARILSGIVDLYVKDIRKPDFDISYLLQQPSIEFLSGGINMPFKHVSRSRLHELTKMRSEIMSIRRIVYGQTDHEHWRDTPEFIENMLQWYRDDLDRFMLSSGGESSRSDRFD